MKILSVSVACYNLGNMIETNIKSFCDSEVANDVELIIVDDGSKDNTPEIVERYVKLYPNTIKFIKQKNSGPGSTVNTGIKNATGKYFRMVDGDDWVNTENLNEFVEYLKSCDTDLVVSDFDYFDNSKGQISKTFTASLEPFVCFKLDDVYFKTPQEMHALTFKTKIFQANEIQLDNGFYTDVEYVLYPMKYVKTLSYFNKVIYEYRIAQAGQSVSPQSLMKNIAQHELVLNHLLNFYNENSKHFSDGQKEYIRKRISDMCGAHLLTLLFFEPNAENKKRVEEFFKYVKSTCSDVYKIFKNSKKALILRLSGFIAYSLLSKIFRKKSGI